MNTYDAVRDRIRERAERVMQPCWISDVKERNGIRLRTTRTGPRKHPCPPQWQSEIEEALRYFGVL